MRLRSVLLVLVVAAVSIIGEAAAPTPVLSAPGSCGDVTDGYGTTARRTTASLPNGTRVDLGAQVVFDIWLAAPSCRSTEHTLEIFGWSAVPGRGAVVPLGRAEQRGNGSEVLRFRVDVRDYAALRDPVDVEGRSRCVYVVARTVKAGLELDRAPDSGEHEVCPEGSPVQPPFS